MKTIIVKWEPEESMYKTAMRVKCSDHPRFVAGSRFDYGFFNIATDEGYTIISIPSEQIRHAQEVAELQAENERLEKENLEHIVKWALNLGLATGHADTLQDLLDELEAQIKEDSELIEAQKREIGVLQGMRDENERLKVMYENLLRESYPITMNACKCGRGKRPGYALCRVCRIKELEAENERLRDEITDTVMGDE